MRYITVEGLSFQYDAEPVLDNIHYHLDSGEFVTLTGENGAAKSTLIKATLGILKPKKGTVTISETNKDGKKLRMAYLPQQIASFNAGFPSTVYEFVKSGRYPRQGWFRRLTKHDLEHVQRALEVCGKIVTSKLVVSQVGKSNVPLLLVFLPRIQISLSWMSQRRVWMQEQPILSMNSCTTRLTSMASLS